MFHSCLGHFRPTTTVSLQSQFLPIFKELKGMHQQDRVLFHLVRRSFNVSRCQTSSDWQSPSQRNEEAIRFANKSTPNYYPKARDLTFENLGVAPSLNEKLSKILRISKPLEIQRLALPSIYRYRNVVIQSQTGSGKTLAYLLPTIQHSKSPCSTVIIVPTRELAYQIYIEARNLTDRRNVACYVSRKGIDTEILKLKEHPPNIIIGTPKQLLSVVQDHEFLFTNIRKIVTDEIDKMVPSIPLYNKRLIHKREKYPKAISKLLAILRGIAKEKLQYIACSATIDDLLMATLKDLGWGYNVKLIKPRAYNEKDKILPSSIKHNYVIVPDDSIDSKAAVVSKMFRRSERKNALVFVHRDHSVREYVEEMKNLHLNAVTFHQQVMSGNTGEIIKFLHDFRTGKISVVVASEEEVRGLDFKELDQVFIFDVPRRPDEYLHLAGRVGRLGRKGTVTTVVSELPETRFNRLQDMYRELDVQAEEIVL